METIKINNQHFMFNSPVEVALRIVFILNRSSRRLDVQRIVHYHYLLTHSSDMPNAPDSLHPKLPVRSCEILVNRQLIEKGLTLLALKDLIDVKFSPKEGIVYEKNSNTLIFENFLETNYANRLRQLSMWVCSTFDSYSDNALSQIIDNNLGKWGSDFSPSSRGSIV